MIFKNAENQVEYAIALYRVAFPDWDNIEDIDGWPAISNTTALYIMDLAISHDKKHVGRDVLPGGLWMNKGFSIQDGIDNWMIDLSSVKVTHKT